MWGYSKNYVTVSRWRIIRKSGIGCMKLAVGLYSGNLLPRLSDNIYFIPSITYYQGLYFRLAGRYIERQTECGEYVYAHKAAKAALAFDPFNSSLNMHLTILLYQAIGSRNCKCLLYRNQAASHGGAYPEDKTNMSEYDYLTAGGEPEMRRG